MSQEKLITVYDKILESTELEFGEVWNVTSGSSTSMRYTKQLNLNGYIRTNIKGRVFTNDGELYFELAPLGTVRLS